MPEKMWYEDFLSLVGEFFEIRRLVDHEGHSDKSICLLRHDVDRYMDRALAMAAIEYSLGICSTYFVLPGAEYYGDHLFFKNCLQLQSMGHEVGLHNNILTEAMKTARKPKAILESELRFLKRLGIKISGTSAHGDSGCRKFVYTNYEIFEECIPPYRKKRMRFMGLDLHTIKLNDYGLYEAYFLPRDYYLTDSQGTWKYIEGKGDEWKPKFLRSHNRPKDIAKFLKEITEKQVILQALLHPSLRLINVGVKP